MPIMIYIYETLSIRVRLHIMKRAFLIPIVILLSVPFAWSQSRQVYTTAQAHSHNDYEQKRPFWEAYQQQFGSIEADLFLVNDSLYAAHNRVDIKPERTFRNLYLLPILSQTEKNGGSIFPQKDQSLQLLIDLKTPAVETLDALVKLLAPYQDLLAPKGSVKIVISGNTPAPADFSKYPPYIYIDGRPEVSYTPSQLERIGLISQSFQKYSKWNGEGDLPEREKKALSRTVQDIHRLQKKVRFWGTPDNIHTWRTMMELQVDYLNTDHVVQMGDYLKKAPR
jgi:hypothetical protein